MKQLGIPLVNMKCSPGPFFFFTILGCMQGQLRSAISMVAKDSSYINIICPI